MQFRTVAQTNFFLFLSEIDLAIKDGWELRLDTANHAFPTYFSIEVQKADDVKPKRQTKSE